MLQFALVFQDPRSADAALATLKLEGFEVELQPQGDSSVLVSAVPLRPVQVTVTAARLLQLAGEHGGEYLGHGGLSSVGLGDADLSD